MQKNAKEKRERKARGTCEKSADCAARIKKAAPSDGSGFTASRLAAWPQKAQAPTRQAAQSRRISLSF